MWPAPIIMTSYLLGLLDIVDARCVVEENGPEVVTLSSLISFCEVALANTLNETDLERNSIKNRFVVDVLTRVMQGLAAVFRATRSWPARLFHSLQSAENRRQQCSRDYRLLPGSWQPQSASRHGRRDRRQIGKFWSSRPAECCVGSSHTRRSTAVGFGQYPCATQWLKPLRIIAGGYFICSQ